ncbi:MAG TPA: riboflavin synthase [Acidobacteriota bacterium]|nr:riboflavin synthase [Acidobacteriota bacterium]HNJ39001.1 riboflavin synthase [Acidobacteriota bacterium]
MFTGIIEELGTVQRLERQTSGGQVLIGAKQVLQESRCGDSIAVNGVCLTVTAFTDHWFTADVSAETLAKSNLGWLAPGSIVNLERALALGQRLGGHIVQGHIDATGTFLSRKSLGNSVVMRFGFPSTIGQYIALKGSIAINGVSLTVAELSEQWFEVAVIPTTLNWTNLPKLQSGDSVNLETDVLAKYLERLLERKQSKSPYDATSPASSLTLDQLRALGF